jgi:outer membrane protein insertion porin family
VQRTEAGTVFSYLPIKVGDRVDDAKAAAAVKALFATGFFRDVRLEVQGGVLIVIVQERPTISKIDITGNKEFDTDTLKKALKDIGLSEAKIFDRSALDRAEQEMKRQYITRGKYAAQVTTTVTPQERNRVAVNINVVEGDSAKIARINIVGNKAFTEAQLLSQMTLTTPGWTTWYTKNDQYSKQKLSADLETIRSFYQNRGYLEFNVESTQVSITPDKEDIYITVNISEGEPFTVTDVRLAGDLPVAGDELGRLIAIRTGEIYSREKLQATAKAISDRLGTEGYAFANVNIVPEVDRDKHQAAFVIYVDPGRRVYVRKINISGNARTRDEIIRREMRQLESAWYDGARIDRSKVRIRRLGYFEDVNIETPPVVGTTDQADIDVTVTEKATGSLQAGIGYSSSDGLVLSGPSRNRTFSAPATHSRRRSTRARSTGRSRSRSSSLTGPSTAFRARSRCTTGQPIQARWRSRSTGRIRWAGRSDSAYPSAKPTRSTSACGSSITDLSLFANSPPLYYQFVRDFGSTPTASSCRRGGRVTPGMTSSILRRDAAERTGRDRIRRSRYYKLNYLIQNFWPVYGDFVLMLRGDAGYGDGYGGKPLPFFKAFYAGGVGSVRGYDTASLGPRTFSAMRPVASARSSAMPSCFTRSSRGTSRCASARFSTPARFTWMETLNRSTNHSAIRTVSALPGIRRSVRSSSAMAYPQQSAGRQDPALSIPGRHRFLTRTVPSACGEVREPQRPLLIGRCRCIRAVDRSPAATAQAADYKIGFVNTERCSVMQRRRSAHSRSSKRSSLRATPRSRSSQSRCATCRRCSRRTASRWPRRERRNRERDLANLSRDLTRSQREFREDLNLRRNEEFASVQDRANKVIQQIAEAEKFDLIIQDPVVYASQKIDITEKVIKALADK